MESAAVDARVSRPCQPVMVVFHMGARARMEFRSFTLCRLSLVLAGFTGLAGFAGLALAQVQQPIGTVGVQDATVAGALEITNGRAVLVGSTIVTAHDHVAEVALSRGGSVRVCATSGLHVAGGLSAGSNPTADQPLMLGLDRGAIEVQMAATTRDVVMTPDLRFTINGDGPLDLNLRVTKNGDTCVENRGAKAPVLHVADPFGEGAYELRAGQHVLFEHASLKEVVDHESSSCGCPPEAVEPAMTIADALLKPAAPTASDAATPATTAAEQHPFPAAVSEGLAPAAAVPQASAGTLHSQVSATLSSSGAPDSTAPPIPSSSETAGSKIPGPPPATPPAAGRASATSPSAQPAPAPHKGVFHAVGRFFRRIFGAG